MKPIHLIMTWKQMKVVVPMISSPIAGFTLGVTILGLLYGIIAGLQKLGGVFARMARPRWVNAFFGNLGFGYIAAPSPDLRPETSASFEAGVRFLGDANGTAVVFETDDADTGWAEAGVGAVFVFTGGHSGFIEYRQRLGHDFLQERLLALGWRLELP